MDKKMTSGEIAKKAGVSQKAVRLYDEKGLLKPTDYSEGNYRLYDKEALKILEKIVALKQIGFSLEEIRDNLVNGEAIDVEEALRIQLKEMENKRYQIEKVIAAINRTLDRKGESLDWDDVADMVQNISLDQSADERHWDALKHTDQEEDWYVKIFKSLNIKENEKVLDLGCGFAKLWRNNWKDIPKNTKIFGYDIHGSWADNFEGFVSENKAELPEGVDISLQFEDLEGEKAWEMIEADKEYSMVVAHYINYELKDPEALVEKSSKVVSKDGVFCFNGMAVSYWNLFFKKVLEDLGLKADFIEKKIAEQTEGRNACRDMLGKYFGIVESVLLQNNWHYTDSEELYNRFMETFEDQDKFLESKKDVIKAYFDEKIEKDGEIVVEIKSQFWQCRDAKR